MTADTTPQPQAPAEGVLTDEQIIQRAEAAGMKWLPPDDEDEGFPGAFDLSSIDNVRRLLSAPAGQAPAPAQEPDMRAICEALGFDPTNHHNAAKCPYCRPEQPAQEPADDAAPTDAQIVSMLHEIDAVASRHDVYEYGLPLGFDGTDRHPQADMVAAVRAALATPAGQAPAPALRASAPTLDEGARLVERLDRVPLRVYEEHGVSFQTLRRIREVLSATPQPAQEPADWPNFINKTNADYAAWCKTFYTPEALDERGMASLHGLWAWQEQERRKEPTEDAALRTAQQQVEGVAYWLLHRSGPNSPEAKEANALLSAGRAIEVARDAARQKQQPSGGKAAEGSEG